MATTLGSPGVQVSIVNESFYVPAAPGTVPLMFVATAQDKQNGSKTGIAQGTTAENAGKVWVITSQRDLTDTFGTPLFYTDSSGNPVHGSELNEYGLQAAYSMFGVNSRAYIVRADVDLGQLVADSSAPKGDPTAGTYWVDTGESQYGVFEWNASGRGSFTRKIPLVIDNDNVNTCTTSTMSGMTPDDSFGNQGDYSMIVTSDRDNNALYYKTTASTNAWVLVKDGFDGSKDVAISPHTSYPNFTTSTLTGSVWVKTTSPGYGAKWSVKYYNGSTESWVTVNAPLYESTLEAIQKMDYSGGGINIPVGTLFIETSYEHDASDEATFKLWRRSAADVTQIVLPPSTVSTGTTSTFTIRETLPASGGWGTPVTITVPADTSTSVVSVLAGLINTAGGLYHVNAGYDAATKKLTIKHKLGGEMEFADGTEGILAQIGFQAYDIDTKLGVANLYNAPAGDSQDWIATNWKPLVYEAKKTAPYTLPANGRLWYDANLSDVDIMEHDGTQWVGYLNAHPDADPLGPIVSATMPTVQSDGTDLVYGDIWVSTADLENYGKNVYVYDGSEWVLQDVTDNNSPDGWVFADARWANTGTTLTASTIEELLISDYVDPDAPDPALYPKGIKLWNLRRSGYNVKQYMTGYIDIYANDGINIRYPSDTDMSNYKTDRWVSVSPNNENGSGTFGRKAQRAFVTKALNAEIQSNTFVRDTDTVVFNLITCPGYPETIEELVALNVDRGQTAFVIGDTPFRLQPNATALSNWGNNTAGALVTGDEGATAYDEFMAMWYPSGYTTDNAGNNIVVPPSHMMLRTIINSDAKSYQWFAPAGTRRGGIDNATSVGYIDGSTGEFNTVALAESIRDVLATVKINSLATLPGIGIVNMAQYTRARAASALDRINVARLICYVRRQLSIIAQPFLFEPNDAQTRREIKTAVESFLIELVGQRALYDFIVVCDTTNNTPVRIDRSELYVDVAIEPVKAVEFIYIPVRIKNTGSIAAGNL